MGTERPRFDGTISLGHMLVVLTLIVSAVGAWMANRERSLSNRVAIERLSGDVDDLEVRVRALEIAGPR
jgi:hypothetical protein